MMFQKLYFLTSSKADSGNFDFNIPDNYIPILYLDTLFNKASCKSYLFKASYISWLILKLNLDLNLKHRRILKGSSLKVI
jgi:hypothetical protein